MPIHIMKIYSFKILCLGFLFCILSFYSNDKHPEVDKDALLERHNHYRRTVGVPDLKWSDELADIAQKWANKLAKDCRFYHSKVPYGENIYWSSGSSTEKEVVDAWGSEKKYFNHKNPTYKGNRRSSKAGHYSQMIWRNTTHVGGAKQNCKHGEEIWVCNYDPYGNVIGEKAY